jgi:polyisoprenyl-phosphate glycosyltransferase
MKLSVVIPAYNEAPNIGAVISELQKTVAQCTDVSSAEYIVIDDHSSDQTFETVKQLSPSVRCIRLSRRSGSHTALRAGIRAAKGDAVLCISADGQDNPQVLNQMIGKWKAGVHTVWAIRESRNERWLDKMAANVFYWILKAFMDGGKNEIDLSNADFYLLSKRTADAINRCEERNTSLFGLIVWLGFKQDSVVYTRRERLSGKTKWTFRSRLRLAKDWVIAFSGIPLKLITNIGIATATLGFLYAGYIFVCALLQYTTPGWAETVLITLFSSGILMIMLGIIGEYLWRTLEEARMRPLYFIEDETTTNE